VYAENNGGQKMKTTNKKLVGGLLIGLLVTAVGAVLATAETQTTTDETTLQIPFWGRHEFGPFSYDLTDDQQAELQDLITTLRNQNVSREEIQAAIQDKLDEFGVLDAQLNSEIEQTQQRLTMLNRQKELRDQGYNWDEINTIIQEEFDLENTTSIGNINYHGFGRGPCCGPQDYMPDEELEQ
jgi:DNA-binding transcriptional MerR regulator